MDWLHGEMLPRFTLRNFLYYKFTSDVSKNLLTCYTIYQPETRQQLYKNFSKKTSAVHNYNTRAAKKDIFYIKYSRLDLQKCSFSRLGTEIWNSIDQSLRSKSKKIFKHKMCQALFTIFTTENHYVDVPMLCKHSKIAICNYDGLNYLRSFEIEY